MPEAPQQTVDNVQAAIEKRAADVNIDGKPPEEAFNLANMQTDNISAIIGGVGDALGIKTQKVTFDQIKEKAAGLGVDERFLTRLLDNNNQMAGNAVDVYRAMQVLEASADELGRLFGLVANGQATDIQKLQLRQQVTMHGLIQKAVKGVQSETARALAVMRVPRDTSNIDLIRRTLEEGGGENSLQDLARAYLSAPNQAAKNQIIEKSMFSTAKDVWFTTWINGLLSSPVTHAKNIAGNTLFGAYQVPERHDGRVLLKRTSQVGQVLACDGTRQRKGKGRVRRAPHRNAGPDHRGARGSRTRQAHLGPRVCQATP
jgi:hypothetical protein